MVVVLTFIAVSYTCAKVPDKLANEKNQIKNYFTLHLHQNIILLLICHQQCKLHPGFPKGKRLH